MRCCKQSFSPAPSATARDHSSGFGNKISLVADQLPGPPPNTVPRAASRCSGSGIVRGLENSNRLGQSAISAPRHRRRRRQLRIIGPGLVAHAQVIHFKSIARWSARLCQTFRSWRGTQCAQRGFSLSGKLRSTTGFSLRRRRCFNTSCRFAHLSHAYDPRSEICFAGNSTRKSRLTPRSRWSRH